MIVKSESCKAKTLENGVARTIKGYIPELMVAELVWKKGQRGEMHSHPHRQCTYIIKGSFEAESEGEKTLVGAGDCIYTEANVPHGLLCLEDGGVILDIFTPMREDFLKAN